MGLTQNEIKKIQRKLKKFQHTIFKETRVSCSTEPSKYLVICNAGLANGLCEELLYEHFVKFGELENILLLPGKSCSFIAYKNLESSKKAYENYNGKLNIGQDDKPIYLLYCDNVPVNWKWSKVWDELPPGLIIIENFITPEEEHYLVNLFHIENTDTSNQMKFRQVKHFGYEFRYDINNVQRNNPLPNKIPDMCMSLFNRLDGTPFKDFLPNQLTINSYRSGQGIPPHIDTHSAFEDPIMSLSLISPVIMEYKRNEKVLCVNLPSRSLAIMSGESRYAWSHGISPRKFDIISIPNGLSTRIRQDRISYTFRKVLQGPCSCDFKEYCDSSDESFVKNDLADKIEKLHVHDVYENIAGHFSETRNKKWPNVWNFVNSLPSGSILLDVGCGNGKYLDPNPNIFKIGSDTSLGLLNICREANFEVCAGNCLWLPFRDNIADGIICIAVIHHLSSEERRMNAFKEIVRVLKVDGTALVYVWAKNQIKDQQKSAYIKQDRKNRKSEGPTPIIKNPPEVISFNNEVSFPIHINRTQFQNKDVLVPWKLKNKDTKDSEVTFLRYYHVFEANELEHLLLNMKNITILNSYYDEGNWCILFRKNKIG